MARLIMSSHPAPRNHITFTLNGNERTVEAEADTMLGYLLREDLGLTGTKIGCSDGQCGSCVVLVDGRAVRACIFPARRVEGKDDHGVDDRGSREDDRHDDRRVALGAERQEHAERADRADGARREVWAGQRYLNVQVESASGKLAARGAIASFVFPLESARGR